MLNKARWDDHNLSLVTGIHKGTTSFFSALYDSLAESVQTNSGVGFVPRLSVIGLSFLIHIHSDHRVWCISDWPLRSEDVSFD